MRVIQKEAARFNNTTIYPHRRSKKEGRKLQGRYIRIGAIFQYGTPVINRRQFMGIHDSLFVTMNYPDYIKDHLGIAADLPEIPGYGPAIWVTPVSCSIQNKGIWYFIPKFSWEMEEDDFNETIKTSSVVSIVTGENKGVYHILTFPLLSKTYLRKKYVE